MSEQTETPRRPTRSERIRAFFIGTTPDATAEQVVAREAAARLDPEIFAAVYSSLAQRRTNYETLLWQVPALSIAAQAFLLTIVLAHDSTRTARLIAAGMAVLSSVISVQVMAKHRYMERTDTLLMEQLEAARDIPFHIHSYLDKRQFVAQLSFRPVLLFLVRQRSFRIWVAVLFIFMLLSTSLFFLTVADGNALK